VKQQEIKLSHVAKELDKNFFVSKRREILHAICGAPALSKEIINECLIDCRTL